MLATRLGRAYADMTVTEAGFGFDLGGEKFLDIKCRSAGLWPDAVVLVATLRALKMHGGAPLASVDEPNAAALEAGLANIAAHLDGVALFGLTPIVCQRPAAAGSGGIGCAVGGSSCSLARTWGTLPTGDHGPV